MRTPESLGDVSMEYKMHESFRQKKRNQLFVSLMTKIENVMCNVVLRLKF